MQSFRLLEPEDYNRGYLELLSQLTDVDQVSRDNFELTLRSINTNPNHKIWVVPNLDNTRILASGTLLIEPKIIHGCASVAHIEDIVVDSHSRGSGLGKRLIKHLIDQASLDPTCYKISLYCKPDLTPFYNKSGLSVKDQQMTLYLKNHSANL